MTITQTKGVYILANDFVYDLTVAFLNSFRKFNPDIPLCLIPFDDTCSKIYGLQDFYHFSIWPDNESLYNCDKFSLHFHDYVIGQYRKLVIWQGVFDEFLYIDIDTVVLQNIDFIFRFLSGYDFITSYSNHKPIEKFVWKESVYQSRILNTTQIEFAANTGFIASKKGVLNLKEAEYKMLNALKLKPHMELSCLEQSFLNYLIVTSGKKFTSLFCHLNSDIYPEKYLECWGGEKIKKIKGELYKSEHKQLYRILFIHWAGLRQNIKADYLLLSILKFLKRKNEIWPISLFMPNRRIWKYYRNLNRKKGIG